MRLKTGMTDVAELMAGTEADIAQAMTAATLDGTDELKNDWRDQIGRAGLGARLGRTVRGQTYPNSGTSLDPASWVWTKAPDLIDAYDRGPVILPGSGHSYLWIPTAKTPRRARRFLAPADVEASFGQKFIILKSKTAAGNLLAFIDVAMARYARRVARGVKRRVGLRPKPQLVLMFTLVRQVKVTKRLDIDALAARAQDRWPSLLDRRWSAVPNRTARMRGL